MTDTSKAKDLKTTVLAFESKLANSDAIMTSGNWADIEDEKKWQPIKVVEKSVRGTISNRLKSSVVAGVKPRLFAAPCFRI